MPLRLILFAAIVIGFAIVARHSVKTAAVESWSVGREWVRTAGPWHLLGLWVIVGAGVLLRLHYLHEPMRWDESYTFISYAQPPLGEGLSLYDAPNNQLLNTLLMHLSYGRFGISPAALRLPAFLCGILVAPTAYLAGAQLYGRQAALLAAGLTAVSAQLVEFSTNARGYSIAAFLGVALLALAPRVLRSTNVTWWGLWAIVMALGLYAVPVYLYPYAVVAAGVGAAGLLGHAVGQTKLGLIVRLAIATGAGLALTVLLYGSIIRDVVRYLDEGGYSNDPWGIIRATWDLWHIGLPGIVGWVLLIAFGVSAAALGWSTRRPLPFALMGALLVVAIALLDRVVGYTRVLVPLLPLFLVAAAGGLLGFAAVRRFFDRRVADIALTAVVVLGVVLFGFKVSDDRLAYTDGSALPGADQIVASLAPHIQPNDRIVMDGTANPILRYAFLRAGLSQYLVVPEVTPDTVAAGGKIYLVVNGSAGETFEPTFAAMTANAGKKFSAAPTGTYKGATLYLLTIL